MRALLLTLAALLCLGSSAGAAYDPLASGTTRLGLDKSFQALLKRNGIKLIARSPARVIGQKAAILPVSGGEVDPTIEKGTIELGGELLLQRKRKRVPIIDLAVKSKPAPLYAKVGGGQQKLATGAKFTYKRRGFDSEFLATGLKLSAKTAVRLNKRLDTEVFEQGLALGSLKSTLEPQTTTVLPTGKATIVLDPALVSKLNSLFVSINPIFPAELAPGNVFSFPIIRGGALSPDASLGTLRTGGSIELLQQGSGQVFLDEFWFEMGTRTALAEVDIQPAPTFPGKLGQIPALALGAATISSNPSARTISISGAPLSLVERTAAAFNEAFAEGRAVFGVGEVFGRLTFTAQGQ